MPPIARAVRRRSRNRASNRTERRLDRRGQLLQELLDQGLITEDAFDRRLQGVAERVGARVGGRVGERVATRLGGNPVAGQRRGARVGARVGLRQQSAPTPAAGTTPPGPGIPPDLPPRGRPGDAIGEGPDQNLPTTGEGNQLGGGGEVNDDLFKSLFSSASSPIIEAGARAVAARRQRQIARQRLLALQDPRILGFLNSLTGLG